ncbi:MAG TPA: tRNA epoxyqueuosine(34) reductase QueG [Terriglobales bacterium]|nr:tRNA epoxyqueuosine(34) reductase QueG [Terriglobales bacterium]
MGLLKMAASKNFADSAKQSARTAGFELCGVARVGTEDFPELQHFPQWIERGHAGEMEYLKSRNEAGALKREALKNVAPWARSVVVCGLVYNADEVRSIDPHQDGQGWISRYAWFQPPDSGKSNDYHDAVMRRLRAVEARLHEDWPVFESDMPLQTRCYVDTGPLVERVYAKYAGLGWIAKNTCVINQEIGSYFFLGVILTSAEVTTGEVPLPADRCGSCTRCLDACPTNAITPYQLDATRCISYLTIEKRGAIPEEFREAMGRHVFGCDICQDVCPWNGSENTLRPVAVTNAPEFNPRPELVNPALAWLGNMTREGFNRVFKDSPIKRAKYSGFRRNVAVAIGNSRNENLLPLARVMAKDPDTNVAEHAQWAVQQFGHKKVKTQ